MAQTSFTTLRGLAVSMLVAAMLPAAPAFAQSETAKLEAAEKEPFGQYLVDAEGRSLYILESDTQGTNDAEPASACTGECLQVWPPLVAASAQAGDRIDSALISTFERGDGTVQVTYNGWPLYYYARDQQPGDTNGQDVHDEWGEWYLIAPSGEHVEEE